MYPTLAEVLQMPVLSAAAPRVRTGRAALDVPVRWVHVSEQRDVAGTLTSGVLVLSSGISLADPATDLGAYVISLREAGAVGLVVELGLYVAALPTPLLQAARDLAFPVVELARAVRFVEVTEVVHTRILNSQFERMAFTQRVNDTFRTLAVEGGGVARVLAEVSALTGMPAVLEDLRNRALSFAAAEMPAATLLTDWTARSRQVPVVAQPAPGGPEGWTTAPVGPRARRWGRLVIPRRMVDEQAAEIAETVLQHAADALTLGRLLGDDPVGPELEAHDELLRDLMRSTRLDEQALRARARALGMPAGGMLLALVIGAISEPAPDVEAAAAAARAAAVPAIVGRLTGGSVGMVLSSRTRESAAVAAARVAEQLPSTAILGAAGPVTGFADLAAALAEAEFVAEVAATLGSGADGRRVFRSGELGARGLLWQLRDDPRLQAFVHDQLGPLLRLDEPAREPMLSTLLAYLDAAGSVTAFARAMRLSRPAAYARLDRLRGLLGRDLDDSRERLSLHLALLALDQAPGPA